MKNTDLFPARVWIIDNSISMNCADGHRVVQTLDHKIKNVSCTRWEEVVSTLLWHATFSVKMEAPTVIRLVHSLRTGYSPQITVASTVNVDEAMDLSRLADLLQGTPSGIRGPLTHLRDTVMTCLHEQSMKLLADEKALAILYVTDRLPVDDYGKEGEHATREFLEILQLLRGSPVFVVIRLSTDEPRVVKFYNDLDSHMDTMMAVHPDDTELPRFGEIHLDVLDDFVSEAAAVQEHNPWLNYAYPLHLCRESAVQFPVFDTLNDRPLTHRELVEFLTLLFDRNQPAWGLKPIPNPVTHYSEFRTDISDLNRKAGLLYDPIKRKVAPWIDLTQMDRIYGDHLSQGCCHIL
jgi:hypothetical protein